MIVSTTWHGLDIIVNRYLPRLGEKNVIIYIPHDWGNMLQNNQYIIVLIQAISQLWIRGGLLPNIDVNTLLLAIRVSCSTVTKWMKEMSTCKNFVYILKLDEVGSDSSCLTILEEMDVSDICSARCPNTQHPNFPLPSP